MTDGLKAENPRVQKWMHKSVEGKHSGIAVLKNQTQKENKWSQPTAETSHMDYTDITESWTQESKRLASASPGEFHLHRVDPKDANGNS